MRVLVLTRRDPGGSWFHLAAQLRHRHLADVRVVTLENDARLRWPSDLAEVYDGGQELAHLVAHADVFHCVDIVPDELAILGGEVAQRCNELQGPKVVLQCDDRPAAARGRWLAELSVNRGWPLIATRPPTTELGQARFVPPFIPIWRAPWMPQHPGTRLRVRKPDRIVFASTSRSLRERPRLEALVDKAEAFADRSQSVRVETLEHRDHLHVLQRRRRSHLVVTAAVGGLGRGGLEALAQGIPTVADLTEAEQDAWTRVAGGARPPVISSDDLAAYIDQIGLDQVPALDLRQWALTACDPRKWFALCERLWSSNATKRGEASKPQSTPAA